MKFNKYKHLVMLIVAIAAILIVLFVSNLTPQAQTAQEEGAAIGRNTSTVTKGGTNNGPLKIETSGEAPERADQGF